MTRQKELSKIKRLKLNAKDFILTGKQPQGCLENVKPFEWGIFLGEIMKIVDILFKIPKVLRVLGGFNLHLVL